MAMFDVVNLDNNKTGSIELAEEVFGMPLRPQLLSEIVHWQRASRRAGTQSALTKGEVKGSVKKPFAQKGRGMARQGTLKNPHQIGGGVAFAPKPRDYSYKMPKTKRRVALAVALSARRRENRLIVLDELRLDTAKTSLLKGALGGLKLDLTLIVDCKNDGVKRAGRNI